MGPTEVILLLFVVLPVLALIALAVVFVVVRSAVRQGNRDRSPQGRTPQV